ncbi:MAG: cytochrome c maturation protein CcmE [Pseudomonadota bacterium]|nr:cytochrome c maturation protein CcmE [Pseudomonadota bacterium]
MNQTIKDRILYMVLIILLVGTGATLIITALNKNINLYLTPSEIYDKKNSQISNVVKVGGLVKNNSVVYHKNGVVDFQITDGIKVIPVSYLGLLPGLFKEGKGVVVEGHLMNKRIQASRVLAKHDENYKPPKVNV